MPTHYYTASSLDGFIATADHSLDWLFAHDIDAEGPMAPQAFLNGIGALIMGASTYEWLLRNEQEWSYTQPVWVFTHRELPVMAGADVRFVRGDVRAVHEAARTAARGNDVWIVGGGDLVGQFADADLLDEVWVQFAPVTLGSGQPLLPRNLRLRLVDTARNRDFACVRYRVTKTEPSD